MDGGNSNYGNFVIYDSSGNLVKSETTFNAGSTYNISATALTNGNILITYREGVDPYCGNFVIWGITDNYNVGIGTTDPIYSLDVEGSIRSTGISWLGSETTSSGLYVDSLGSVGIGTTSPDTT
jgi:hypothetical protein